MSISDLPVKANSQLDAGAIARYLAEQSAPMRLACLNSDGWPLVASHWYAFEEQCLWFVVHENSHVYQRLRDDSRCSFEFSTESPPYRGVRGQGWAEALIGRDAEPILRSMLNTFTGTTDSKLARWLLGRVDQEVVFRLTPRWLTGWDYSERMSDS